MSLPATLNERQTQAYAEAYARVITGQDAEFWRNADEAALIQGVRAAVSAIGLSDCQRWQVLWNAFQAEASAHAAWVAEAVD
jgi:hypothetical protein